MILIKYTTWLQWQLIQTTEEKKIAKELVKQAFIVAKKAKCNGIKVLATSDYTRKIFKKMGFETIGTKIWKDCEHLPNKVDSFGATGHFIRI